MVKSFLVLVTSAMVLVAPAAARDVTRDGPRDTLLLFVAAWCAPCREELSRVEAISRAARPRRVLVVPLDSGERSDMMLRGIPADLVWRPAGEEKALLQRTFFKDNAGLPFSVLLDEDGETCANNRLPLDVSKLREMVARCDRRSG